MSNETADSPVARLVERARVDSRREALAEAADRVQLFQPDAIFEEHPRIVTLLKLAISDDLRRMT